MAPEEVAPSVKTDLRTLGGASGAPSDSNTTHELPAGVAIVRTTSDRYRAIARRLVSRTNSDIETAARRLVENAAGVGIDLSYSWYSTKDGVAPREVCLAVPGAGRTAMLFVSEPAAAVGQAAAAGQAEETARVIERAALVTHVCDVLAKLLPDRVRIAQALPEPDERWAIAAYERSGMISAGKLHYLRRAPAAIRARARAWPEGVRVRSMREVPEPKQSELLVRAMDASYEETLDCPELCGLRETRDILSSHRATGIIDPSLWWVADIADEPVGCGLFTMNPDQRSFELVYLGIAKLMRGKGLGRALLEHGLLTVSGVQPAWSVSCAVDTRNTPALKLYESLGFRVFAERAAFVKPVVR